MEKTYTLTIITSIGLLLILAGVYLQDTPENPELTKALEAMNEEEQSFFKDKILEIREGMDEEEVTEIIGSDSVSGMEVFNQSVHNWNCPDNTSRCQISIRFIENRISEIIWVKEDNFTIQILYDTE